MTIFANTLSKLAYRITGILAGEIVRLVSNRVAFTIIF